MIASGALDGVDEVYGTHLWTNTPYGIVQTSPSELMAAADKFEITIKGKGGHGAIPHQTTDSIVAGSQVVTNLQQLKSRRIDPLHTAVLSIGTFYAGNAYNIIPGKVEITGTVRTFDETLQQQIIDEMERIIQGTCVSFGVEYDFHYTKGYPAVVNHEEQARAVIDAATSIDDIKKAEMTAPSMTGEDFAYFVKEKPGAFFFTGAQRSDHFVPHHHHLFDFDERAMLLAAKTFLQLIEQRNH